MTMEVRAQLASVFHLDKCIGCHTCSVVCKNLWTDRRGSEHMWWNNVETRPGTGYPALWEDQERHHGGFVVEGGELRLRLGGRGSILEHLFQAPRLPTLDDQYEPWTYRYEDLFQAKPSDDLPTARPVSAITGRPVDPSAGPNWDDDLAGSDVHASADPNLAALTPAEREALLALEGLVFFHLPRTCNHCLNPACAAACPSGAIYKRGEDGVVLIDRETCRGWRMCVPACPYKKTFHSCRRASPRSASAATRGSRTASRRPASRRASAASATRASCSTTRRRPCAPPARPSASSSPPSAPPSSIPPIPT